MVLTRSKTRYLISSSESDLTDLTSSSPIQRDGNRKLLSSSSGDPIVNSSSSSSSTIPSPPPPPSTAGIKHWTEIYPPVPSSTPISDLKKIPNYIFIQSMHKKREKWVAQNFGKHNILVDEHGCAKIINQKPYYVCSLPPKKRTLEEDIALVQQLGGVIDDHPPSSFRDPMPDVFINRPKPTNPFDVRRLPVLDFKEHNNRHRHEELKKCAALALKEYNLKVDTDYHFVDIVKVHCILTSGMRYFITFRARKTPKGYATFEANVHTDRVERKVSGIRIKRRGSTWYDGTLRELIV